MCESAGGVAPISQPTGLEGGDSPIRALQHNNATAAHDRTSVHTVPDLLTLTCLRYTHMLVVGLISGLLTLHWLERLLRWSDTRPHLWT